MLSTPATEHITDCELADAADFILIINGHAPNSLVASRRN
jgi:hypothetical protein